MKTLAFTDCNDAFALAFFLAREDEGERITNSVIRGAIFGRGGEHPIVGLPW